MISIINYHRMRILGIFALIVAVALLLPLSASTQEQSQSELKQAFEQSFQEMLRDPSNVDIALKYAGIAVNLGNYEAAIPPLERILIFNPDLPKIKLELGVLYFRLDSMKMAKSYFEDAAHSKSASKDTRASAIEYLQKIPG